MKTRKLSRKNLIYTDRSGTTVFVNYSESSQILEVKYRNENRVYHYYKVEPDIWEAFKKEIASGGSSGVFVNTVIKPFYMGIEVTGVLDKTGVPKK
jgi:hypothetical protein